MRQRLADLTVKNAKPGAKPGKLADANGLYLHIDPSGAKYWRYRFRAINGKETVAAIEPPRVSQ
jgi:hypothetical protein